MRNLHLQCDKTDPHGCKRCAPQDTRLCCDLCNPEAFSNVAPIDMPRTMRGPNKSSVTTYDATENDKKLYAELVEWRDQWALEALGPMIVEEWGPELFMSDETLKTLTFCAHINKLPDVDAIRRETRSRSDYLAKFGAGLLEVIQKYAPLSAQQRGLRSYSACGQPGHNCTLVIAALVMCAHLCST